MAGLFTAFTRSFFASRHQPKGCACEAAGSGILARRGGRLRYRNGEHDSQGTDPVIAEGTRVLRASLAYFGSLRSRDGWPDDG